MSENIKVKLPLADIRAYCETQPIRRLSLLGPDFDDWLRPDTDVGLLVEYVPGAPVGYFDMAGQEIALGAIMDSRIDLRTAQELSDHHRLELSLGARSLYAQETRE